ncbi:MAG: hypothetical protein Q8M24_24360 [Pseudolabrys sp.]|nr:hypothetical protein [Pseudolabrys sp.]MDP2298581.1 hypothetical protein [Pseudolabrys sp.]
MGERRKGLVNQKTGTIGEQIQAFGALDRELGGLLPDCRSLLGGNRLGCLGHALLGHLQKLLAERLVEAGASHLPAQPGMGEQALGHFRPVRGRIRHGLREVGGEAILITHARTMPTWAGMRLDFNQQLEFV